LVIFSEGQRNLTSRSGHLAAEERGGGVGVGCFGRLDSRAEEEIDERGHATAFAPKQRGKQGVGLGAPCGEMDGGGESSAGGATRRKEENRARRPGSCVGAAERGAGWAVSSALRKQGRGRARGLCVSAWAGWGKE
jgi:hypothetical protein